MIIVYCRINRIHSNPNHKDVTEVNNSFINKANLFYLLIPTSHDKYIILTWTWMMYFLKNSVQYMIALQRNITYLLLYCCLLFNKQWFIPTMFNVTFCSVSLRMQQNLESIKPKKVNCNSKMEEPCFVLKIYADHEFLWLVYKVWVILWKWKLSHFIR